MKIALLTNGIYPYVIGGMQKHSYYLAKYMARNGIFVDIYNFVESDKKSIESLTYFSDEELRYIDHHCIVKRKSIWFPGHYIAESYLISMDFYNLFLKYSSVDFVYAQGFSGWYYAKQRSKGVELPPIGVNFHGLEMFQPTLTLKAKIEYFIFRYFVKDIIRLSDFSFSLGGKLTAILNSITGSSIIEIPIGIDKKWLVSKDIITVQSPRKFVFIGRNERRKGLKELIQVLENIIDLYDFRFHFIGDVPENIRLDSDIIIYHGVVSDEEKIKSILSSSDILILPSHSEGMPTVVLEAMASGCAIIATDVGAVDQEVDSSNGWLIPPNDIQRLQKSIEDALDISDIKLLEKQKMSIKKVRERYTWDIIAQKTIDTIKIIIKDNMKI
jgi:glycosyltransferase involved in cell wall biosynthesis